MVLPSILVSEVVFDGVWQVELFNLALLDTFLVDVLADDTPAKVHERKRLGWKGKYFKFKICLKSAERFNETCKTINKNE